MEKLVKCPECGKRVTIKHEAEKRIGLCLEFSLCCITRRCNWTHNFSSSPDIGTDISMTGRKYKEVNCKAVMAFREIGKGHEAIKLFTTFVNMPLPMTSNIPPTHDT